MQLHQLKPKNISKKRKRVGRGGKRGTYSGRGMKGQKSRAGRKMEPIIRRDIKRYPKLRGYKFKAYKDIAVLNLDRLNENFKEKDNITPIILVSKKIVRRIRGKIPKVKILGTGEISKKIFIEDCLFSLSAKEKIEKAGGTIKEIVKKEIAVLKNKEKKDKKVVIKEKTEKKGKV